MMRTVSAAETVPTTYPWAVHAEGLRVRAGRHLAVDGLDLALGTGVHGLLGPNGAGKTTLIRALATVVKSAGGRLTLLGEPVDGRADLRRVRRGLGYLPQQFGFYPRFTLREFVEYMAWLKEMPKTAVPGAVQRAIDRVGLAAKAGARMKTLSGGMLRRAGIAQAIVNDPAVLVIINEGRLVHQGTPDDLIAQGGEGDAGDSPAERGYSALLRRHRAVAGR